MSEQAETFGFQTEAKQLLKLMIQSLYSNREIFLRELISNASDAIDRLRFRAISEPQLLTDDSDFAISVGFDADAKTVTIEDNGVGMTREEVIDHLGTIAKSGTAEFLERLTGDQKQDATLIGQFGVGFYSAFIVAEQVEVLTRGAGTDQGTRWASAGEDEFTVEDADANRGTKVILHLRDDALEFADGFRLRAVVRKYSDHIGVPVRMQKQAQASDGQAQASDNTDDDEVTTEALELETVNSATALWTLSRSKVEDDEYKEFYKHISHDFEDPLSWSHNKVEGKLEYTTLLYLPKRAPFDLWNRDSPRGLKLYVQRVFIMDEADQFLPMYLRFVKGIVDSNDLPLNVSREILQQDERVTSIKNALTKRILSMLDTMSSKEQDQYQAFWDEFGEVLKEGAGEDFANREALFKLLRFASTRASTAEDGSVKSVALDEYLERMVDDQEQIYYVVAESFENAKSSPHLEVFREKGIEVLLLFDRIDEWLMANLTEYQGKHFQDVMRANLELPGAKTDDAAGDEQDDEHDPLTKRIHAVLAERVEDVRVSERLTDSPACLVMSEFAMGAQMKKLMEASGQAMPDSKPTFEYNAEHPLLVRLDGEADEERFADLVSVLFDQASLAEGGALTDAPSYVSRMNRLLLELLSD